MGAETVAPAVINTGQAASHRVRIPSVLRCGIMIFAAKMALKSRGFEWTIDWIRRQVAAVPKTASVDLQTVKAAEHAVAIAGAFYPGRARCLEQSLVLYYLLRRQRVAVEYRQGVQPHPFEGHAWVEYQGEIINDIAEHTRLFRRLPDQLP